MSTAPYDVQHVLQLLASHQALTGRALLERATGEGDRELAAREHDRALARDVARVEPLLEPGR